MREIREPNRYSEFEIQAWLWNELRRRGVNIRGEVKVPYEGSNRRAACRFDLAEFVDGKLAGIVEVKPGKTRHRTAGGWLATRQGQRYGTFGVPVHIVYGMDDAEWLVEMLDRNGTLWPKDE